MQNDLELLREYATNGSEEAFATLVSRHIRLVYGAAMRHAGDAHQAEEITQAVFVILARKAASLPRGTVLSGWLFQTARLTACNHIRNEIRRKNREQEASMQSNLERSGNDDVWRQVAPLLDSAIASLGNKDRNAVVLRFIEGRELAEVGQVLGASESAAQRRVNRAVDKLRKFFTKRGVVMTGAILASSIAANAAPAAPASLATSITTLGALKGATVGASTLGLIEGTLKVMAWAKFKVAASIGAGVVLATGTAIVAVTYAAETSHHPSSDTTLSANSPFVRQLSSPPWIKQMRYAEGRYVYLSSPGTEPLRPTLLISTNIAALQPSGMYLESVSPTTGGREISGVDNQIYWNGTDQQKSLQVTPVAPEATFGTPVVESIRPLIEEPRNLGLPALRPGTFKMQDGSRFTAVTLKGETFEGEILKVSHDRPLALSYRLADPGSPPGAIVYTITYQYASDKAPLPESFGHTEVGEQHRRGTNGTEQIVYWDRSNYSMTFRILSADYGLDKSVTNGYSPSRFFPDAAQYRVHASWMSNGMAYIDGVARPDLLRRNGAGGTATNRVNK